MGAHLASGAYAAVRTCVHKVLKQQRACKVYLKAGLENWMTDDKFLL
jgi:hypothetical protein